jgi:hypothetical protein
VSRPINIILFYIHEPVATDLKIVPSVATLTSPVLPSTLSFVASTNKLKLYCDFPESVLKYVCITPHLELQPYSKIYRPKPSAKEALSGRFNQKYKIECIQQNKSL